MSVTPSDESPEVLAAQLEAQFEALQTEITAVAEEVLADTATLDLSLEEVVLLAESAEIEVPAPIRSEVEDAKMLPGWSHRLDAAGRGLAARHFVDADGVPSEAVSQMLNLFDQPLIIGQIEFEFEQSVFEFHLCADEEVGGECVQLSSGLFRFSVFPVEQFPGRLVVRSGLMARPHEEGSFTTPAEALVAILGGPVEPEEQVRLLCDGGAADEKMVARFVDAIASRISSTSMTVLFSPSPDTIEGGSLSWIDGGLQGLWRIPDADEIDGDPKQALLIRAATSEGILAEIESYLTPSGEIAS
ncbi:unannotated protein [freshwater metagenome]|uniref:Unannotated protein n=1 Tax=freshwater metagenome TaxID=449393 RepID=A0A6J6WYW0_9ZZZZ|nr:hypothetical protein [Actinomycetota bacterium]